MTRRWGLILTAVLAAMASHLHAQDVRMEVGVGGGIFPAGEWTRCRIQGLEATGEPGAVTISIGQFLEVQLPVREGRAEGRILLPDRSSLVTVTCPGTDPVALSPEVLRGLHPVAGRVPVLVIGEAKAAERFAVEELLTDRAFFPIRMSPEDVARSASRDLDWVHVIVLGALDESQRSALKDRFGWLSRSVVIARKDDLGDWLNNLPFKVKGDLAVLNAGLAEVLPVPMGSVRRELYRLFEQPEWPFARRLAVALMFGGYLLVTAVGSTFLLDSARRRRILTVILVGCGTAVLWAASRGEPIVEERLSLLEYVDGSSAGVRTEFLNLGALGDTTLSHRLDDAWPCVPVTASLDYWARRRLRIDTEGVLTREMPAGSWQVFTRQRIEPIAVKAAPERAFETDGIRVCSGPSEADGAPFGEYLDREYTGSSRRILLRRRLIDYWNRHHRRDGCYRLGWERVDGDIDGLMAVKVTPSP